MLVGYTISGNASNDAEFFDGSEPEGTWCKECGTCLNTEFVPSFLSISKSKKYDISYTQDLRTIFSENMALFLSEVLNCAEIFKPIKTSWENHYYVYPKISLPFDAITRKTKFISPCSSCGGFRDIVGAHPAFLKVSAPIENGLFKSDVTFSSYKSKHPLLFVSHEWMEKIKAQRFRGVVFHEVHSTNTPNPSFKRDA
ncbi:MAG TPA: hypothetical protein VES38_02195 [Methylotenera sp.]|nr:hypothetical protein [Methylotenera sp.]